VKLETLNLARTLTKGQ